MIRILRTPTQPPPTDTAADRQTAPAGTAFRATLRAAGSPDAANDAAVPRRISKPTNMLFHTSGEAGVTDAAAAALAQSAAQTIAGSQVAVPVAVPAVPTAPAVPAAGAPHPLTGTIASRGAVGAPDVLPMIAHDTAVTLPGAASEAAPTAVDDDNDDLALGGLATALAHSAHTVIAYRSPELTAAITATPTTTAAALTAAPIATVPPVPVRGTLTLRTPHPATVTTAEPAAALAARLAAPPTAGVATTAAPRTATTAAPRTATTADLRFDDSPVGVWLASAARAAGAFGGRTPTAGSDGAPPTPPAAATGVAGAGFEAPPSALTPLEQAVHDLLGRLTDERAPVRGGSAGDPGELGPEHGELPAETPMEGVLPLSIDGFAAPRATAPPTSNAPAAHAVRPEPPEPPANPSHIHLVVDDGPERVVVTVAMRGNDVHVAMRGSDDTTTAALARNAGSLDHAMRARGLVLGELTAEREPQDRPRQPNTEPQERRKPDPEPFELEELP